jgi:hypothetical protein
MLNRKNALFGALSIVGTLFCLSAFADTTNDTPAHNNLDLTCRFDGGSGSGKATGWESHCSATIWSDGWDFMKPAEGKLKVVCGDLDNVDNGTGHENGDEQHLDVIYDGKAWVHGHADSCELVVRGDKDDAPVVTIQNVRMDHDTMGHDGDKGSDATLNYNFNGYNFNIPGRCAPTAPVLN